jgi:NADPH:quinone reductase-like Zn-dependent oxidoreductase
MKAYNLKKTGMDTRLELIEYPAPEVGANEVLIETKAFSINPVDIKTRMGGGIYGMLNQESSVILGWDISGVVAEIGNSVTAFKVGDNVFGMVNFPGHGKAYATHVKAREDHIVKKPDNITHQQAAASTLAALTARQILYRHVKPQMRVLIHGSSGGVGHFAVQFAKMLGAYIIATTSTRNIKFVKSLGANEVIDYTTTDFSEKLTDIDFVLDAIAGEVLEKSIKTVKKGGVIISIPTGIPSYITQLAKKNSIHVAFELVESNGRDMQFIADLLERDKLLPTVSHDFLFNEIEQAHKQMATGRTRGKIVVSI